MVTCTGPSATISLDFTFAYSPSGTTGVTTSVTENELAPSESKSWTAKLLFAFMHVANTLPSLSTYIVETVLFGSTVTTLCTAAGPYASAPNTRAISTCATAPVNEREVRGSTPSNENTSP